MKITLLDITHSIAPRIFIDTELHWILILICSLRSTDTLICNGL